MRESWMDPQRGYSELEIRRSDALAWEQEDERQTDLDNNYRFAAGTSDELEDECEEET